MAFSLLNGVGDLSPLLFRGGGWGWCPDETFAPALGAMRAASPPPLDPLL
jgi:hypothetical protein